jgi:hypothetical protein
MKVLSCFYEKLIPSTYMAHLPSTCPICNTIVEDISKGKCNQCDWRLDTENLLDSNIRNSLLEWAICHYQRVRELEHKQKYHQNILDGRLHRHREDIDRLQRTLDNILTHAPEINSILRSKQTGIDRDNNSSITIETSIIATDIDSNLLEPETQDAAKIDTQEIKLISTDPDNIDSASILAYKEEISLENSELTKAEQEIVADYNYNISQFVDKYHAKNTRITTDSINTNWISEEKIVVLEETNRGNYWTFNYGEFTYLVPDKDSGINEHRSDTVSTIFHLDRYNPNYHRIQLIKPAIVSIDPNTNPQTWRLQERGELVFL